MFDYVAKACQRRTIVISDELVVPTVRALVRTDNGLDTLWCYQQGGAWRILHSRDVGNVLYRTGRAAAPASSSRPGWIKPGVAQYRNGQFAVSGVPGGGLRRSA